MCFLFCLPFWLVCSHGISAGIEGWDVGTSQEREVRGDGLWDQRFQRRSVGRLLIFLQRLPVAEQGDIHTLQRLERSKN